MASANYARRRRNAILAAVAMALVFILIIIVIASSILGGDEEEVNNPSVITPGKTDAPGNALPTLIPQTTLPAVIETPEASDDPVDDPFVDPDVTPDADVTPTAPTNNVTPTPTAPQNAGTIMYVTGDGVNVREAASAESDKVTSLAKGTSVTAYEKVGDFYNVKLSDGKMGYIHKNYVSTEDPKKVTPTPTPTATTTPDTSTGTEMFVTGEGVNVRKTDSASSDKVAQLVKGKQVTAYKKVGDWTYIRYGNDKYGYIMTKYLSTTDPTNTPTPTPTSTATTSPSTSPTVTPTATPEPTPRGASFADLSVNISTAVAAIADQNTSYLNDAGAYAGRGEGVVDGTTVYYYKINTKNNIEINGKTFFYIWYEGSASNPTNVQFKSVAPGA